jgi:DNA repair photolyase
MRARGTSDNPANRFEALRTVPSAAERAAAAEMDPRTELPRDPSRTIVATNQSPDIGFNASVNPYRGCEHGCVYCYARPTHEYLGFSAGLDFETKVLVKEGAPELLARSLRARRWKPQVVALSGVTDPYQPAERHLEITRRCLRVLADFHNPVALVTKSWLVTRDVDLLAEMADWQGASVAISITTLDRALQHSMEPRAAAPSRRLAAIETLARAGVPVGVMVAPVIPGLTDHELPAIVAAASRAGAGFAAKVLLRLPHGVKELFESWLQEHQPERRDKVMHRIRQLRGGRLYDSRYGLRGRGEGPFAAQLDDLFSLALRRAGLPSRGPSLSTEHFRVPKASGDQLDLFGLAATPTPASPRVP